MVRRNTTVAARSKQVALTPSMRSRVSQVMQCALLDEILSSGTWRSSDIVFQGGTSIHLVWNSPRFSEDLDFMVSVERAVEIVRAMDRAARKVSARMQLTMPNSEIRLKSSDRDATLVRNVIKHELVWSDPAVMGSVRVRADFFTVEAAHLASYKREGRVHRPDASLVADWPELEGCDVSELTVHSVIPAAHPESIYGDKLVALAKRDYLKPRDFFDLWWLTNKLGVSISDDELYDVVRRSADCYTYDDAELVAGFDALLSHGSETVREVEENLAAFLPVRLHRTLSSTGAFGEMYEHVRAEAVRTRRVIEARCLPAPGPSP
jgi:predicted nucleotidyltransferase component of viral defense system